MKNKINQFYSDIFNDKRKMILLPQTKLYFSVRKDGQYSGSFVVKSADTRNVRGLIYTSDFRMHLRENGFDSTEAKISFTYDAFGLTPGALIHGSFYIESEAGEYEVHYTALIEEPYIETSIGRIVNLKEFTKLAAYNYKEATSLFSSTRFRDVLELESSEISNYYEGFRKLSLNQGALEEFLIGTGMKNQVHLKVLENTKEYPDIDRSRTDILEISKNTWGYLPISVETEGTFIRVERERFSTLEFTGNRFELTYMILREKLHDGKNFGAIRIVTPHSVQQIDIVAYYHILSEEELKEIQAKKTRKLNVLRHYIQYRCKKETFSVFAREVLPLLDQLILDENCENESDSLYRLLKAHIFIEQKQYEKAADILENYEKKRWSRSRNLGIRGYYMYLSSLCRKELSYSLRTVDELRRLYDHNDDNWELLWVLLQVEENLIQNGERRLQVIGAQWKTGKFHSLLYLEAFLTLMDQPGLIDLSDPFIIHTLLFADHRGILTKEVASSIAIAVARQHDFRNSLFEVLRSCYRLQPSKDMLTAICRYLIMGHCTDSKYFPWYERGVNEGLHIARLYEYYLYAVGDEANVTLPEAVFLYFSHQNELGAEKKTFLYANLVRHIEEYPEIYDNNRKQMEAFTKGQLLLKRISPNLRVLYRHFLPSFDMNNELRDALADILYTYDFKTDHPDIRQVIVLHDNIAKFSIYTVSAGKSTIQLYTGKDRILLRDTKGYVFADTVAYDLNRSFPEERYFKVLKEEECRHIGLMLSSCESEVITEESEKYYEQLATCDGVRERTRIETKCKLLFYHFENDNAGKVRQYLSEVDDLWLDAEERSLLIGIYLKQNQLKKAYDVIRKYGFEEVDLKYLLALCSRYVKEEYYHENPLLLSACYTCFVRGQYDESMLLFLADFFCGKTEEMKAVWKVALERGIKVQKLEERILTQMLFTEELIGEEDIFYHFYVNGGNERLRRAYLSFRSYGYFVNNQILEPRFFEYIETEYAREESLNTSCKLASIRFYAQEPTDDPQVKAMLEDFLDDCLSEGYLFSYFCMIGGPIVRKYLLHNRIVVQYQSRTRAKVTICYAIIRHGEPASSFQSEIMREAFQTYYLKEFVLFAGEELQYYIIEENDFGSRVCEVNIMRRDQDVNEDDGRLYAIDRILSEEHPEMLLDEYEKMTYLTGQLFQIL